MGAREGEMAAKVKTKVTQRRLAKENAQLREEHVAFRRRLDEINNLVKKAEHVAQENKELLQQRTLLASSVRTYGQAIEALGGVLQSVGGVISHSVPVSHNEYQHVINTMQDWKHGE